jgi:acylphosphatase
MELRGYRVRGRVQGVGFRWWTERTAVELGLCGHVRNLPDGSVEVHVVGTEEDVRTLESLLRDGPPGARVESVEPIAPDRDLPRDRFHIRT